MTSEWSDVKDVDEREQPCCNAKFHTEGKATVCWILVYILEISSSLKQIIYVIEIIYDLRHYNDASEPLEYFYSMNNTQMRIARTNFRELLYVGGVLCQTDVQLLDSCWRAGTELVRSQKIRKKNDGRLIVYLLIPVSYHIMLHLVLFQN